MYYPYEVQCCPERLGDAEFFPTSPPKAALEDLSSMDEESVGAGVAVDADVDVETAM